jgi:hypothetical protein
VTCGTGCCPAAFSQCCQDASAADPTQQSFCAPSSATCCPVSTGASGFCVAGEKCCPTTQSNPYGECVELAGTCCTNAQGGETCSAEFPTCCAFTPGNPLDGSYCCPPGSSCCDPGGCPTGRTCDDGCCVPEMNGVSVRQAPVAGRGRSGRIRGGGSRPQIVPAT